MSRPKESLQLRIDAVPRPPDQNKNPSQNGAKTNVTHSNTKLHLAAMAGNLTLVQKLAARGTDIDAKDNEGRTALHWAAHSGHLLVVKELLKRHT